MLCLSSPTAQKQKEVALIFVKKEPLPYKQIAVIYELHTNDNLY